MGIDFLSNLETMKMIDIKTVDKASLVDLNSVVIDESKSVSERVESFLQQIRNPYCFRIGNVAVKVNYKSDGPTFQKSFEEMLRTV